MPIRLLAIDLDGTLLTNDREPHSENVLAIRRALDSGIRVVLSSGRTALSIQRFAAVLGLDGAMICNNGAHVQGDGGVELLHLGLSPEAVNLALDYVQEANIHISGYTRDSMFVVGESQWLDLYIQRVKIVKPELVSHEALRQMSLLKMILIDTPDRIRRHHHELDNRLANIAFLTESEPEYLEVLSPDANKGKGLEVFSHSLGIAQSETAAIGDYLNDIEMIQWAGIGAAMGNAVEELKSVADIIMPTNSEAGVATFIDYLIELNATTRPSNVSIGS